MPLPLLAKGAINLGGAIGSALLGKKAAKQQTARSPEEQAMIDRATQAGQTLLGQGQQMIGAGMPGIQQSQDYFGKLLGGNRAAQQQAVGSSISNISDTYRGAERGLGRSGLVGSARDQATADLNRQKAGQIAGLTSGVQPGAAQQLASTGLGLVGNAGGQTMGAASIFGNLLNNAQRQREMANAAQAQAGREGGGKIFDAVKQFGTSIFNRGVGGGANGLPGFVPGGYTNPLGR